MFDVRSLLENNVRHHYIALKGTLFYLLPKEVFLALYNENGQFATYFNNNLSKRQLVEVLLRNSIRTRFIMALISSVNEQIIKKAFELVVPPALTPITPSW